MVKVVIPTIRAGLRQIVATVFSPDANRRKGCSTLPVRSKWVNLTPIFVKLSVNASKALLIPSDLYPYHPMGGLAISQCEGKSADTIYALLNTPYASGFMLQLRSH
jgi:hypothetical protein